jgi:hypothetical protein
MNTVITSKSFLKPSFNSLLRNKIVLKAAYRDEDRGSFSKHFKNY